MPITRLSFATILAVSLASCGDAAATQPTPAEVDVSQAALALALEPDQESREETDEVVLPQPEIELPQIPYDKQELPRIQELDELITRLETFRVISDLVRTRHRIVRDAAKTTLHGTEAERSRQLSVMVDAFLDYQRNGLVMGELLRDSFLAHHESDEAFTRDYDEIYKLAEKEVQEVVKSGEIRRKVLSAMHSSYRYGASMDLRDLNQAIEGYPELRDRTIRRFVDGVKTDLHMADYEEGEWLAASLGGARNRMEVLLQLDPENADVKAAIRSISEKLSSRQDEIARARKLARFPRRYDRADAPKNVAELEKALRKDLKSRGYRVEAVHLAGPWTEVRSILGIHMHNTLEFHVAVECREKADAKAGVLDILHVTARTRGAALETPFGRIGQGRVAQMLKANL
ncbi:MAG: hypothetical protein AAF726_13560 [Planctomycetota bacterium]